MKKRAYIAAMAFFVAINGYGQKYPDFSKIDSGLVVQDGFFFYLPRTAIEFEFTISETKYIKGELSSFAGEYFQSPVQITQNRSEFQIDGISSKTYPIPDPTQKYRYSLKLASLAHIQTYAGGVIKSINAPETVTSDNNIKSGNTATFKRQENTADSGVPFFSLGTKTDTIINREIMADSTIIERRIINRRTVTNTPAEMAKESVQKLDEIRKTRYMLISGPEDVVIDGTAMATSLKELDKAEQELLALFFGKTQKNTQTYRIVFIPGESTENLFFMGVESGIGTSTSGVKVHLKSIDENTPTTPSYDAKTGIIPYRPGQKTRLSISWNGNVYYESELTLPQFGQLHYVSIKDASQLKVIYDDKGGIESIGPFPKK